MDPLTGFPPKAFFPGTLKRELARTQRTEDSVSLLMLDADNFKSINDRFGYQAGDNAITAIADCIRRSLRTYDVPFRKGGDEFYVILSRADREAAVQIMARLDRSIREVKLSHEGTPIKLTASIGMTTRSSLEISAFSNAHLPSIVSAMEKEAEASMKVSKGRPTKEVSARGKKTNFEHRSLRNMLRSLFQGQVH
jgi:diguanylate cyclase (GGDEF)-like protein